MNYKILFALTIVLIISTLIALGCTRSLASRENGGQITAATNDSEINVSNSEDSFVPLVADENADANAKDVLIAASKAKAAPMFSIGQWINSEATTLENQHGRVVLVDFWTFGCYNCRNTLPTLKRFDTANRDKGLIIRISVTSSMTDRSRPACVIV